MKIVIGTKSGFCYGVKKAVTCAEVSAKKTKSHIYTLGPLIHNNYEVNRLKKLGVIPLKSLRGIKNKTILIRAHGLPKNVISIIKEKKNKVIDTTCPFVKKVQNLIKKLSKEGYNIIIFGEKKHPEVVALASYSSKPVEVIQSLDELNSLSLNEPVAVVSQTTQSEEEFKKLISKLKNKYENIKILNTICAAAAERQREAEKIAKQVQLMLVVGGKNSGNTVRLRNISCAFTKTYHIESSSDIKKSWFKKPVSVGIITGTSTPQWLIEDIIRYVGGLEND
ncbi:MAG: 4-hydroxy-3-methylbut-2-enyl diphosphate reductase [Elusimicrobiota bacterium]|nr:4-hydroxy-3-methylbut-2-enyl diphosphate reductase [Elusimicrobiota bacterium]